nr:hypothetical protein [Tanacetum cinerariifolium]
MNTTQAQQKALDDALVAPGDRLEFGKCNMRFKTNIKPKEATFQVVLDALAHTPFCQAFLITVDSICYCHQQVLKWRRDWNGRDSSVPCSNPLGEKAPKPEYVLNKDDLDTSPKKNPVQATKGTTLKTKAKVAKSDKKKQPTKNLKTKGLAVLSEGFLMSNNKRLLVQMKELILYQRFSMYPYMLLKVIKIDEEDDDEDDFEDDVDDSDDNDEVGDERTECDSDEIPDPNKSNEEHDEEEEYGDEFNIEEDEKMDEEEDDEGGANQQNASQQSGFKQEEEDAHVTLTPVLDTQKTKDLTQSSPVSSDSISKLLNLDNPPHTNTLIASLIDTTVNHKITSATTVPPPPPLFIPLQQKATPTPTPTTSEATTLFTYILNFTYVFKFNKKVTNMKKDLSEIKQVDQYAQSLSSIPAIVHRYMDNKLGEANKAIQAHNFDFNTQLPQILPQAISDVATLVIEKNVNESLKDVVLKRSSSQPQSSYEAAATLFEFELTKILIDKMKKNKSFDVADYKRELYDVLVKSYNTDKDIFGDSRSKEKKSSSTSKDASQSQHKSSGKSAHAEEPSHTIEDSSMQQDQEFVMGDNDEQPADKEVNFRPPQTWISQVTCTEEPPTSFDELSDTSFYFSAFVMNQLKIPNLTQEILVGPAFNLLKGTYKSITELKYHLKECSKATTERLDWHNPENKPYSFDLKKPLSLIQDHRVTRLKIMKKYDHGHLEQIEVRQDDQKLYTFKKRKKMIRRKLKGYNNNMIKKEHIDWNVVAEQIQEKHLDNIRKYQSLKGKPVSIAQARKNMIIYLKNMAGYKMEHIKGMTYDKKDYPMSNAVMIMMLSVKLQVEEDCEMARDLVMKIFIEANKPKSKNTNEMIKVLTPKTTEEVIAREKERKARTTLLMALPEDHLAKFHKMDDAKGMWEAIKSRFGGNDESNKMQKYLLKQQFKGFSMSTSEGLHKWYDRFQTLLSQLEIHGAGVSHEDANQKFLKSLPSSWSQVDLIMRTKPGLDTLSFDDLYNNLRVFKHDVKGTTTSSSNIQNVAFVSTENTSSTNDVSTAYSVSSPYVSKSQKEGSSSYTDEVIHSFFANQSSAPRLDYDDLEQINDDDMEEMDLKCKTRDVGYNGNKARDNGGRPAYQDDSKALVTIDTEDIDWPRHVEEDAISSVEFVKKLIRKGNMNAPFSDKIRTNVINIRYNKIILGAT